MTMGTSLRAMQSQLKWLRRLVWPSRDGARRRLTKRTPMPPKPYVDVSVGAKQLMTPELHDPNNLADTDPSKPHWQEPCYESRESVPVVDLFGFNRDWSWTMFKLGLLLPFLMFVYEIRVLLNGSANDIVFTGGSTVSAVPDFARDDKAVEEELREAGYTYVGVTQLDSLRLTAPTSPTSMTGSASSSSPKMAPATMNEIYARRLAQGAMFHQLMRLHGTLWAATQVTKEKLDVGFVKEEFMRINGRRAMPLLVGAAAAENFSDSHLCHLCDHCAWAECARADAVQRQTPVTQHVAAMGRMAETLPQTRATTTCQNLFNEQISRIEGISTFDEEPTFE